MSEQLILTSHAGAIATVTLNRPEALNALSAALRSAIIDTFAELAENKAVQVIILTGAGRAFTVGLDLKELGGEKSPSDSISSRSLSEAMAAVPQPIIGAINGFAITGGFELALMCDFLIASSQARFADTHARVGVVPGWGLSQRLPRLIGINRAKELSLTGNFLDAETACQWGLVNRVVPPEALLSTCESLAADIVSTDPLTRSQILKIMDEGWHTTLDHGLEIELAASREHAEHAVSADKIAARRAAIQSRGRNQSE